MAGGVSDMASNRKESLHLLVGPATFLVVGGGAVGRRKAQALLDGQCRVRLVDPVGDPELVSQPGVEHLQRVYRDGDLDGMLAVFACTDNPELNAEICAAAEARGMLFNNGSAAGKSTLRLPAVQRTERLSFAVSTADGTPTLARLARELIVRSLPMDELDSYGAELAEIRLQIPSADRPRIMARLADPEVFQRYCNEGAEILREYLNK